MLAPGRGLLRLALAIGLFAACVQPRVGSGPGDAFSSGPDSSQGSEPSSTDVSVSQRPEPVDHRDGAAPSDGSPAVAPDAPGCPAGGCNVTATAVSAREAGTCALLSDGSVRCWGTNFHGELGIGSRESSVAAPMRVSGLDAVRAVAVGNAFVCAVGMSGGVYCWGGNFAGQLGSSQSDDSRTPVPVIGLAAATGVAAGDAQGCAVVEAGVACWGLGRGPVTPASPVPAVLPGFERARAVAAGRAHVCAILADGRIRCLGSNTTGQLGDGTTTQATTPVDVAAVAGATSIASGDSHVCAVVQGTVRCWGYNGVGQLGNGTTQDSSRAVTVAGVTGATAVAAGVGHTCAVDAEGRVWCWGNNANGQLGNDTRTSTPSPVQVNGLTGATGVAVGARHSCALVQRSIRCWGDNFYGQLGNGTSIASTSPAAAVKL
jgi:alpha-tubulin suppressor-like RCC1 family protein